MASAGISLKIRLVTQQGIEQEKTMKFPNDMALWEVCKEITDKTGIGGADHGVFVPPMGLKKGRWLHSNNTLKYYDILSGSEVYFKKKHRMLKVKLVDGTSKTVLIDDSSTIGEISAVVCKKVQINNPEEYSLRVEGRPENEWLNHQQTLHDQDVKEQDTLILGKKFFFFDANIDRSDPVQLHLFYSQAKEMVLQGKYPLSKDEAIQLAAIQLQVAHGDYNPERMKKGFIEPEKYLPPSLVKKFKSIEKDIYAEHKKLVNTSEINAKYKYVHVIRSLKTFGITTFHCRERGTGKKKGKWIPVLIGIAREKIMRMDPDDMNVVKEYPLTHLKRWAAKTNTFTFDFGDHEEDYYQVQTTEGDAMSQLIAGYIDIILRSRLEKAREREDDSALVANPEMINPQTGFTTGGMTANYTSGGGMGMVMQPGQMPQYQNFNLGPLQTGSLLNNNLSESQKINVIDMKSAQRATGLLSEELEKDGHYEGYDSSMTIDHVKNQIGMSAASIEKALLSLIEASGPENVEVGSMNNSAKTIASEIFKLANMARIAAAIGGSNDVDVVTGAQKVSSAISRLMEAAQKVAANPHDPKTRALFENAARELREAMLFLKNAKDGKLNDIASEELATQLAELLSEDMDDTIKAAMAAMKTVKDGSKMREIANLIKALTASEKGFQETVKVLAATMIDPVAKEYIISGSNELAKMTGQLLELVRTAGATPELVEALNKATSSVSSSISQLVQTIPLAEPRSGADLDFQVPHSNILAALAMLRESSGDTAQVLSGIKAAVANTNELVNYAKKVAEASDSQGQQRLNNIISSVNDSISKLITAAKEVAQKPGDAKAFENLIDISHVLESLTQELVTDAGSSAATISLRYRSKDATTRTIKMLRALQQSINTVTDTNLKQQIEAQIESGNSSVQQLILALRPAVAEPQNHDAQLRLLQTSQQLLMPASQIVAATKRVAPGISDANQKQALNYSANSLSEQLQKLMSAIKNVSMMDGQQDIEEALEQFNATNADIEAAEFAAQGGFLVAPPGQTRDDALELLDQSVSLLLEDLHKLEGIAKDPKGRQIGEPSKNSAIATAQVAAAVKTVASTTSDKQMQSVILAQAKKFNKDVSSVISVARAVVMSRKNDPLLLTSLANSLQTVKNTLSSLNAAARGLDSREVDETIDMISKESEKLSTIKANGTSDEEHKASLNSVLSLAKALNSSMVQLGNVARANPRALGPTAKLATSIISQFFNASKVASSNAPNQETANVIIQSTVDLASKINLLLTACKDAASRKDQSSYVALNTALANVSKAIEGLSERNKFPEVSDALKRINNASTSLENPQPLPEGNMNSQQILDALDQSSHSLGVALTQLVSVSRIGSDKIGIYSLDLASNVELLALAARSSLNPGTGTTLSPQSAEIIKLTEEILANPEDDAMIRSYAKQIALCASKIIGTTKAQAQKLQNTSQQQELLKHSHSLATSTSKLARATQAPKSDEKSQNIIDVTTELKNAILNLESHKTSSNDSVDIDSSSSTRLIEATKLMNQSIVSLIRSAAALASATDNEALSQELSFANKSVTDALSELIRVSNAFNPGKVALDDTYHTIQTSISDLDSASIQLAIGKVESKESGSKSHQDWQEEIVNVSRDLATTTSNLVDAVRQDSNKLKEVAITLNELLPKLVIASKATAATTSDTQLQSSLLAVTKELAEAMLAVVRASKEVNPHNRDSQHILIEKSTKASQSIGKLVSLLKANVVIYQELEEISNKIMSSVQDLDTPVQSNRQYNDVRDSTTSVVMSISDKASNINNADRANLGNIAVQSKQLFDLIPSFVSLVKEASFVTKEEKAKHDLTESSKKLLAALSSFVKRIANSDPKIQESSSQSFNEASQYYAEVLKALKSGSTGEILIENAIETIKTAIAILNQSYIFAQANQLEVSPEMSTVSIGSMQSHLVELANLILPTARSTSDSARKSQEDFGMAAQSLANTIKSISEYVSKGASKLKDNVSQQNILNASKALAITSQQLVLSGREAQRNSTQATLQQLTSSVESVSKAIEQLLQTLQDSLAEATMSEKDLENAKTMVSLAITGNDVFPDAQAEDVVRAAKDVTRGVSELVFAGNHESIVKSSKSLVESTQRLLATARGATNLTQDTTIRKGLVDTAVAVATTVIQLLEKSKLDKNDDAAQMVIEEAASDVTTKLSELVKVIQLLPNTEALEIEELSTDMSTLADSAMDKTAKIIIDAAKQLEEAYKRIIENRNTLTNDKNTPQHELERLLRHGEISEQILLAAQAITSATAALVEAATQCQKERKEIPGKVGQRYRMDPTWNNGLISASKAVSDAVITLVRSANLVLDDKLEEEALIVAAKMIAASTAQLVTASKVRGNVNSPSQLALTDSAKRVASATNQLLEAARKAGDVIDPVDNMESTYNPMGGKIKEFEEQMRILKLEKELMAARKNLGQIRKAQYDQSN